MSALMSAIGGKADMASRQCAMSAIDPKRTSQPFRIASRFSYDPSLGLGAEMRRRQFLGKFGGAVAARRSPPWRKRTSD